MREHGKLYAIVSVLAICVFALVFMGCIEGDDGGDSGETETFTFTSIGDFHEYLSAQPANTAAAPYNIKLLVRELDDTTDNTFVSIGAVLLANSNKYVSLELYGVTTIPANIFSRCATLTRIIMSYGVTSIGNSAFTDCTNLTGVTIPDSVINIGNVAFSGCTSLTSVTIPKSVTSIGDGVFSDCTGLTAINVDSGNANYSSENGIVYNKNKTTLVAYPAGKTGSFDILNSVTSIGDYAFYGYTSLTSITIPDSITSIGYYAFQDCTGLTSVTFQGTIYYYYFNSNSFDGDLYTKFYATDSTYGTPGTYTTTAPVSSSSVWTKR